METSFPGIDAGLLELISVPLFDPSIMLASV